MKIVVGASKPNKFKIGAALIKWWENTNASHVYIRINVYGDEMVFQAVGSGTQFISYNKFTDHNIPVYEKEIEISEELFISVVRFVNSRIGTKYSFKHLVGLFYKRLIQYVFKKIVKNPFADGDKSEVCVEAMFKFMSFTNIIQSAEDPEDMGIFESLLMIKGLQGKELING